MRKSQIWGRKGGCEELIGLIASMAVDFSATGAPAARAAANSELAGAF